MSEEVKTDSEKQENGKPCKCCKCRNFFKNHKKLSWTILSIVVILAILRIFLGVIVKSAVSTAAPLIAGVPVTIGDVSVGVLEGYVALSDVKIGNPEGFKAENMLTLKKAVFDLGMRTLFADKLQIEEITVEGLDLYYEQKLTTNNVSALLDNLQKKTGASKKEEAKEAPKAEKPEEKKEAAQAKKLQVDKIQLNDITTHVVVIGTTDVPIMMVPINLTDLGTGPDGITALDLFTEIMKQLSVGAANAVVEASKKTGSATMNVLKDAGKGIGSGLGTGTQKVKDLIGK